MKRLQYACALCAAVALLTGLAAPGAARAGSGVTRGIPPRPTATVGAGAHVSHNRGKRSLSARHGRPLARPLAVAAPRPVVVYLGQRLVAAGVNLRVAIRSVHAQVPFAIQAPRFVPAGYVPVELAVTPRQRGVSGGLSTLTYVSVPEGHGHSSVGAADGFQIDQASRAIPFVGRTRAHTVTAGRFTAAFHEFKAAGADIVVLTWVDSKGVGYALTTPAPWSRLSPHSLARIAASLS